MADTAGKLLDNITLFAAALRKAGVKVGPSQVDGAVQAVQQVGFSSRADFYHLLRATMINKVDHLQVFHQIFHLFWRDPEFLQRLMQSMLPMLQTEDQPKPPAGAAERRAKDALWDRAAPQPQSNRPELELDAQYSWSAQHVLRHQDFEQMSVVDLAQAQAAVRQIKLPAPDLPARRMGPSSQGSRLNRRATLAGSFRTGGEITRLVRAKPKRRPPDLVVLCDISGSMAVYAQMMMHLLHGLVWGQNTGWGQVHGFTIGTQLTNITRALHHRDPDLALSAVGQRASDWKGGTQIGAALRDFNRHWARRVLGQGAVVLLITDGLERGDTQALSAQTARLARMSHRLIWLNPLLRFEDFQALAQGVKAILPHVDNFHPCHSLDSLDQLAAAFNNQQPLPHVH